MKLAPTKKRPDNVIDITDKYKKKKSSIFSAKGMLCILLVAIAVLGVLFSPIFSIKNLTITEIKRYTRAELCQMLGVSEGMNLFLFQTGKGKRTLLKDEYIEKVTIKKTLPNTVSISIIERTVCGYVPYRGAYLYIDEYGRVLDVATSYTEPLPIVKGLEFTSFQKGELLSVKNPESFDVIVQIAQLIKKYKILDMILEIDVSDPKDIKAYINKVEIFLGSIEDCDEKIRNLIEIMKEIPEKDRGSIDLRDMSKMPVFKYLT